MINCEFCKNTFSSVQSLNKHQHVAKYCLKLQGKPQQNLKPFQCEYCEKKFTQKIGLQRHLMSCKNIESIKLKGQYEEKLQEQEKKYEEKLKKYEERIETERQISEQKLQFLQEKYEYKIATLLESHDKQIDTHTESRDKLYDIAVMGVKKSTTTNNNNNKIYNDFKPITQESISEFANNLTIEDIEQGTRGYARFLVEGPLKDNIACSDYARKIIKYKQIDGRILTDPEGVSILKLIGGALDSKNKELITEMNEKLKNGETKASENMVLKILVDLSDSRFGIQQARDGNKTPFTMDLVKELCSLII